MHTSSRSANQRNSSHVRLTRRGLAACAVALLLMPVIGISPAGADEVTDLQSRADHIAQQLNSLQDQLGELGERFNQSQVRRSQLAEQKTDIERRSQKAGRELAARKSDAAKYALSAYVGVTDGDTLSMALDGKQLELSRRNGYATIRIGDRQQVVDDLQAAQDVNDDLMRSLDAATQAERRLAADLEAQQRQATELIAEQQRLQSSINGKLAKAVAQRQAEIAAAQAAAAQQAATQQQAGLTIAESPGTQGANPNVVTEAPASTRPGSPSTTRPGWPPTTRPVNGPTPSTTPPTTSPPVIAPPPIAPPPPATGRGQTAVNAAISQLGVPYSWGGGTASGPSYGFGPGAGVKGFDCSGLTLYAWAQAGVYLYHSAQMQYDSAPHVALSQLQPGDLVFYGSSSTTISHVSIYVGGGQVIHAPNHTTVVKYGTVNMSGYWSWIGAARPG